jgi:hypothetical protein
MQSDDKFSRAHLVAKTNGINQFGQYSTQRTTAAATTTTTTTMLTCCCYSFSMYQS